MILVAGGGAMGASIAYRLALARRRRRRALRPRARSRGGSTARAMGGVRQQFSTAAEVRLAQESIAFFAELGPPFFDQVGYLFLATTEQGLAELEERRALQAGARRPGRARRRRRSSPGSRPRDVLGAVFCAAGRRRRPARGRTRSSSGAPRELGVEVREHTPPRACSTTADTLVIACGPWSAALGERVGVELPVRPLCRQLLATEPLAVAAGELPMVVEAETGFHFRRRGDRLVLAMTDAEPRWGFETTVDESVFDDRLARLARRFPPAAGAPDRRGLGGALRHDPRRAPDPRQGRRRRLCRLRLLGPRLHAVAGGRRRRSPRRSSTATLVARPRALPARPLRRRRRLPRDASSSRRTLQARCASTSTRSPPIPVIAGAAVSHDDLVLEAADGNRFAAFAAQPDEPAAVGIVVLPDVRGLYRFYEELALRFAERGYAAVAIDYFGRTAGVSKRDDDFEYMEHVAQTTPERDPGRRRRRRRLPARRGRRVGLHRRLLLRRPQLVALGRRRARPRRRGRLLRDARRAERPAGPDRSAPREIAAPILALQAGDDQNITAEHNAAFDAALTAAGRRARGRHLRRRAAQLLRPQVRGVRRGLRGRVAARRSRSSRSTSFPRHELGR